MNAVTIRRLLVFGVCAVGVSALYIAPIHTRSPQVTASPRPVDEPSARASDSSTRSSTHPVSTASTPAPQTRPASVRTRRVEDPVDPQPSTSERPRRGATAFDPARGGHDRVAPAPVRAIVTASVTEDRLTLSWPPASDNVAVTGYRVWLDGFAVATTTKTRATIRWFNDDAEEHVVQVRAMDAAGNESPGSPTVLVARPTPRPDEPPAPPAPAASTTPPESSAAPPATPLPATPVPSTPVPSIPVPSTPVPSIPVPSPNGAASAGSAPDRDEPTSSPEPSSSGSVR